MANNRPSDALSRRQASERDLNYISQYIGGGWELLAAFLLQENSSVTVEQIKDDHRKCQQRVFNLLLTWWKQTDDQSLAHLFHLMFKAGTSVTIEWRLIADKLGVSISDVRACKNGYQPPVQPPPLHGERMEVEQDERSANNNAVGIGHGQLIQSMEAVQESGNNNAVGQQAQPMEGVQESGNSNAVQQQVLYNRHIERNANRSHVSMDGGHSSVGGRYASSDRGQSSVDGAQPGSSVSDMTVDKDACLYDGRLIKLTEEEVKTLDNELDKKKTIGHGSFGEVYSSEHPSKLFKMHVAVKKIRSFDKQEGSIAREMITSRITHPFILPLLAVAEIIEENEGMKEVWFVSPLCEKNSLHKAIKVEKINGPKRVRILLQLAIAIRYIHTEVPGVRDVILHKDISTTNVVLDANFNARLIDFGSAREKNDFTNRGGGKVYYMPDNIGKGEPAKESLDYYAFGVIIRELLTSLEPEGCTSSAGGNIYLKNMTDEDVKEKIDKEIWGSNDELLEAADKLNEISKHLLQQNNWKVGEFTANVVEELRKIHTCFDPRKYINVVKEDKCHSCLINEKATHTSMKHSDSISNCRQKIVLCIACEKNSFLNPVECYCGEKLTPGIGSRWGALLVAGKDKADVKVTQALVKDVQELQKLLTSHAPRIFGISESNIRTVIPDSPDKSIDEKLWPKVKEKITFFSNRTDIDTMLLYFTCHGKAPNKATLLLGSSDETVNIEELEGVLDCLKNIQKLIIILDQCYPPSVQFKEDRNRIYVQINSCKPDQEAKMDERGSHFTRWLIQGLKAKSESMVCGGDCRSCIAYWKKNTNFITVENLYEYIKGHLKKQTPTNTTSLQGEESIIAYYTGARVQLPFSCETRGQKTHKLIPLDFLKDIDQLKNKLKIEFGQNPTTKVEIRRDTYRNMERKRVCENLEEVMFAWVQRQELEVVFNS